MGDSGQERRGDQRSGQGAERLSVEAGTEIPALSGEGQVWVLETGYIVNPDDPIGYDGGVNTHS